jgi:hypothetical protein
MDFNGLSVQEQVAASGVRGCIHQTVARYDSSQVPTFQARIGP